MTKRIFKYICCFVFCIYLVVIGVTVAIFYNSLCTETKNALRVETAIAAQGVEKGGSSYFENLSADGYRITWVDAQGKVLFDSVSDAESLGNHLDREEIKDALEFGFGESSRYSDTILSKQYYCAQSIADGTVVRLSVSHDSVWAMLVKLIYPILYSSLAIVGVCVFVAYKISQKIVKPLNEINVEEPAKNTRYREIEPLLTRLEQQQLSLKRQEGELNRKRDEFNAITYGMKEGIILLNEENVILSVNHAAQSLFENDRYLIGKQVFELTDLTELLQAIERAKNSQPVSVRAEIGERVVQIDVTPIFSDDAFVGAVVLLLDITEKEQAESMRREFTSNVSHELKTPLHSISGHAELLLNGLVKQEDQSDFLRKIYDESLRMIALVEDIIHLSSLEENTDFVKEPVDLWSCVRETAYSLKGQADQAKVFLSVDGAPVNILAVPRLVNVIIHNLVDNAIKYNRAQGSVSVLVKEEEEFAVLYVKDTGIGIPYEAQERVFERFYRVDKSRSKSVGGTGLGLSIVKHAARILDAKIELISAVNEGTTMIVRFPKAKRES